MALERGRIKLKAEATRRRVVWKIGDSVSAGDLVSGNWRIGERGGHQIFKVKRYLMRG
jgi:hypothetical protein